MAYLESMHRHKAKLIVYYWKTTRANFWKSPKTKAKLAIRGGDRGARATTVIAANKLDERDG